MDASLVDPLLRPRQFWVLLAGAAALPGCPPTDDYFLSQTQPTSTAGASAGNAGQPPLGDPHPACGNGVAEGAEGCDGADLRGASCESLGQGTGLLTCVNCKLDNTGCEVRSSFCGDGVVDPEKEGCDGADLRQATCEILGYEGGTLSCTATCQLDTDGCTSTTPVAVCGNGSVEEAELCDGLNLRSQSCQSLLGQASGTLRCTTMCTLDASDCTLHRAVCGDGAADGAESCDGADLQGYTCETVGFEPGKLACTTGCTFDTSGCGTAVTGCDGQGGSGGTGSACCVPAAEICDGRSNDCDTEVDEGGVCPDGCIAQLHEDRLYLLCIHPDATAQRDYADASADCAAAATTLGLPIPLELAHIESSAENQFVKGWIQERIAEAGVTEGMVWNGANDIARETRWVWGQGLNAVQFFQGTLFGGGDPVPGRFHDFAPGRPNSANATDEDCGGFDSEADWRWNDRLCTRRALGFVCEQSDGDSGMPPPTSPPPPPGPMGPRPWP